MTPTNDYQGSLQALSQAVSQSVVTLQLACTPQTEKSDQSGTTLLDTMRGFYTHHVKPYFENKKADEALEREIGTAFGALITHLQAIHASWLVFSASNNKHISHATLSEAFVLQAVQAGQNCYNVAVEAVSRLLKEEAQVRGKAETFIEMVRQEVKKTDRLYCTNPYSSYRSGYAPLCLYIAEQTRKRVLFQFDYWDGVDACYVPLGELFPEEKDKKILEAIALKAFGPGVRFKEKHSVIEVDETA